MAVVDEFVLAAKKKKTSEQTFSWHANAAQLAADGVRRRVKFELLRFDAHALLSQGGCHNRTTGLCSGYSYIVNYLSDMNVSFLTSSVAAFCGFMLILYFGNFKQTQT